MASPRNVRQAATELEEFFDLSIDLLCVVGFDGSFKRANASLERTLGYPEEELFTHGARHHTSGRRGAGAPGAGTARRGIDLVGFETRVVTADGGVRWVEWNTRTVPEHGVVYGVGRDTTERRQADAALREAHALLETGRDELRVLADQQAALRRVATLVAQETATDAVFAAVTRRSGRCSASTPRSLVGTTPTARSSASRSGARTRASRSARASPSTATACPPACCGPGSRHGWTATTASPASSPPRCGELGIRFAVGVPISVTGRTWGVMTVTSKDAEPFPRRDRVAPPGLHGARGDLRSPTPRRTNEVRDAGRGTGGAAPRRHARRATAAAGRRSSRRSPRRSASCWRSTRSRWSASRTTAPPASSWPAGLAATRVPDRERACRSAARTSLASSSAPGAPRASTTRRTRAGRSPRRLRGRGARRPSATPIVVEGRLWGAMLAASDARRAAAGGHRSRASASSPS